jgi:hypothetical protein
MKYAFNLADAHEKAAENGGRIWGADRRNRDGRWTKCFYVGGYGEAYFHCARHSSKTGKDAQLYELIDSKKPCVFHTDVEVSTVADAVDVAIVRKQLKRLGKSDVTILNLLEEEYCNIAKSAITEDEMLFGTKLVVGVIIDFLNDSLCIAKENAIHRSDVAIISGCRANKFSLHVICPKLVFDSNVVSLKCFVFELARHVRDMLERAYSETAHLREMSPGHRRFIVRALKLDVDRTDPYDAVPIDNTPIDESIYSRNRLFRCVGCAKEGSPILRLVSKETPLDSLLARDIMCHSGIKFHEAVPSQDDFFWTLVQPPTIRVPESGPIVVHPSKWFFRQSLAVNLIEVTNVYDYFAHHADCFYEKCRFEFTGGDEFGSCTSNERAIMYNIMQSSPMYDRRHCEISVVDDTHEVLTECKEKKALRDCRAGDVVFHWECEVGNGYIPKGCPSAKIVVNAEGDAGLYCFNCRKLCWSIGTHTPEGLECDESEVINSPYPYLNDGGRCDVNFDEGDCKVFVLDAPPGTGKTKLIDEYINQIHPKWRVLAISFRIALAEYLAARLNLTCYDDEEWDPSSESSSSRLVICINSLPRIQYPKYDVVVLDEAGMTRRHFASEIMERLLPAVYSKLGVILRSAGKIIIAQHELTERDLAFYTSQICIDASDRSLVKRRIFNKQMPIYPVQQSQELYEVVSWMVTFYRLSFNYEKQRSNFPFIVFCTSADLCMMLTGLLIHVAPPSAKGAIKGVWADVQTEEWPQRFLKNPGNCIHEADVVLVTSVLQAGLSIESHFKCAFWFLSRDILSHKDEVQFVSRLRSAHRVDLSMSFAYIEKGIRNDLVANVNDLIATERLKNGMPLGTPTSHMALQAAVTADVRAERHDTNNRHHYLWRLLYNRLKMAFDQLKHDNTSCEEWTPVKCKDWMIKYSMSACHTVYRYLQVTDVNDISENEAITKALADNKYYRLGEEVTRMIASARSLMKDEGLICSTLFTKALKQDDMRPSRLPSIFRKLRCMATYLDYLAHVYAPRESSETLWDVRLKRYSTTSLQRDKMPVLSVLVAVELFKFLCHEPYPQGQFSVKRAQDDVAKFFDTRLASLPTTPKIADAFKILFGRAPGKYYKCRDPRAKKKYSVFHLVSCVLSLFHLKVVRVQAKSRKKRRIASPEHVDDHCLEDFTQLCPEPCVLSNEHLRRTLLALAGMSFARDFPRWMGISFLETHLREISQIAIQHQR